MTTAIAEIDRLDERLAEIQDPGDAKKESKWADVMQEIAKAVGMSLAEQNRIAEHRLRAMRRGGAMLIEINPQPGRPTEETNARTLRAFGLNKDESARWQIIARIREETFERYILSVLDKGDEELTVAGLLRMAGTGGGGAPHPVPEAGSEELTAGPLLRFCQPDLSAATIMSLILQVAFPDAVTALDVTYGGGAFWDGSAHVAVTGVDIDPSRAPDGAADFRALTFGDNTFDVVVFDPPHLADAGAESVMRERYGTYSESELPDAIVQGCREAWRVARLGIVVKVTDHVHGQRFVCETDWVKEAIARPLYDVVHQTRSGAMVDPKWEEQLSAYNNGSSYLIFRKDGVLHKPRKAGAF